MSVAPGGHDARRGAPDPTEDRHTAFPDDSQHAPLTLPESAWARPAEKARPWARPGLRYRPRPGWRSRAAAWTLILIIVWPQVAELIPDPPRTESPAGIASIPDRTVHLEAVPGADVAPIQPTPRQFFELPTGPSIIRIEVVGEGDVATETVDLDVVMSFDGTQVRNVELPYAAEFVLDGHTPRLQVTAVARAEGSIQCRVYADHLLVALDTSDGLVECLTTRAS